jgi:hypothetical protein
MLFVVAVCALVGALAGIAGSAAAPSSSSKKATAAKKATRKAMRQALKRQALRHGFGMGGPGFFFGGGPVHDEAVIPKADGSGFLTITSDRGDLLSVDDHTLHIKQADGNNVYKDDAAITVGSDVKVIRDRKDATLADLKAGDHVRIITGAPKGDIVVAEDDAFQKQEEKDHGFGHHHGFGPPGPPPGAPAAPGTYPGDQGGNQNGSNDSSSSGSGSNS